MEKYKGCIQDGHHRNNQFNKLIIEVNGWDGEFDEHEDKIIKKIMPR